MSFRYAAGLGLVAIGSTLPAGAQARAAQVDDVAALKEEIAALRARLNALEARLDEHAAGPETADKAATAGQPAVAVAAVPAASTSAVAAAGGSAAASPAAVPTQVAWKGAPKLVQGDWSFKPKGRMQFDAVSVQAPKGLADKGLGFASEIRRLRLGGEGTMPGDFFYRLDMEFAENSVDVVDALIGWRSGPLELKVGNQNQFQSLDELVGDTVGSVMERAAFTDAFNFERRLGVSAEWHKGALLAQGGLFTDSPDSLANSKDGPDGGDENNSYGVDGRLVYAPRLGDWQLHFGASAHWRDLNRLAASGVRYSQRPFSHATNTRLLDTGSIPIPAEAETHYGVELAAVRGRWHAAGEAHWMTVDRVVGADTTFFGGYGEIGYYLTPGDSRVYRNGTFDRSPPKRPLGKGGAGSVLLTLRYDYLNLNDRDIRGGVQNGYIAGLVWAPIDYIRFNLNYARMQYSGATPLADGSDRYGVDVIGLRAEFDY